MSPRRRHEPAERASFYGVALTHICAAVLLLAATWPAAQAQQLPTSPAAPAPAGAIAPATAQGAQTLEEQPQAEGLAEKPVRYGATYFTPAIDARAIITNNPGPDEKTGLIHRDTVVEVQPSVVFERHGPRLTLTGNLAVSSISYIDDSHPSRVLPRGRVNLATKLIEDLLFFDAQLRSDPTFEDPFVTRPGDETSYRLQPRTRYTLSPYLSHDFLEAGRLLARTDYSVTRITDLSGGVETKTRVRSLSNTVTFGRDPRPLGYSLDLRSHNESDDQVDQTVVKDKSARLWVDAAVDPQVSIGFDVGREEVTFTSQTLRDTFRGARLRLRPTPRTNVRLEVEKRYFGTGWDLVADHRTRLFSIELHSSRVVSSQDVPELNFGAGDNIADVLNRILLGSISDPTSRQQEINRIIAERNLPAVAGSSLSFYSTVPRLRQSASLNIGVRGIRNLIFIQHGYLKSESLQGLLLLPASSDVLQQSTIAGWNLRVTPLMTFNLIGQIDRTERISGPASGQYSKQRSMRAEVVQRLTPHSSFTIGARRLNVSATEGLLNSNDLAGEKAAYVGVRYRF